jgi:hypothetical protein
VITALHKPTDYQGCKAVEQKMLAYLRDSLRALMRYFAHLVSNDLARLSVVVVMMFGAVWWLCCLA